MPNVESHSCLLWHLTTSDSDAIYARFLNCQGGKKIPGRSILDVGVQEALKDAGYDEEAFYRRGGVFEWTRPEGDTIATDW